MKYVEARVVHVDTDNKSCSAITVDGINIFDDISYVTTGLTPGGLVSNVNYGDVMIVSVEDDGQCRFQRHYSPRQRDSDGKVAYTTMADLLKNFRQLPGDQSLHGPDGAWLNLIKGRQASVGASPLCQTIYLGLEGLVRTVCQNLDTIGSNFRVYSVNGKTRLCFGASDVNFVNGATNNADCPSESFEYQIDFDDQGVSLAVGDLVDGKRKNNFSAILRTTGELNVAIGENTQFTLWPNGMSEFIIMDDEQNQVYNKTLSLDIDGKSCLINEMINGSLNRTITGSLNEIVEGSRTLKGGSLLLDADTIDTTAAVNRKVSGVNISEIKATPKTKASSS